MPDQSTLFDSDPKMIYLNHAAISPWPKSTVAAIKRYADMHATGSRLLQAHMVQTTDSLRDLLARLIGAPSRDIALLKNTSEGLSIVASGLSWKNGDEVVLPAQEFPSNRLCWQDLAARGVTLKTVDIDGCSCAEERLLQACTKKTRLMAFSAVQYQNGQRLDWDFLAHACHDRGILSCADMIQSLGVLPLDLRKTPLDFVVSGAHKWLLSPEGIALFYCRPEHYERLQIRQFGWHMMEDCYDFTRLDGDCAKDARRFEPGTMNALGICGFEASLKLLLEQGIESIRDRVQGHCDRVINRLQNKPEITLLTPYNAAHRAGIVTVKTAAGMPPKLLQKALHTAGVAVAARGSGIRFSPHFYQSEDALEQAMDIFLQLCHKEFNARSSF